MSSQTTGSASARARSCAARCGGWRKKAEAFCCFMIFTRPRRRRCRSFSRSSRSGYHVVQVVADGERPESLPDLPASADAGRRPAPKVAGTSQDSADTAVLHRSKKPITKRRKPAVATLHEREYNATFRGWRLYPRAQTPQHGLQCWSALRAPDCMSVSRLFEPVAPFRLESCS
jgi:hypothetical protein